MSDAVEDRADITLLMITGLEIHWLLILPDRGQVDRDRLAAKLTRDFDSLLCMPGRWNDPPFDLLRIPTPKLMLVGHSFGGDTCLSLIHNSPGRRIDSLVLLDPVPNNNRPDASHLQHDRNFKFVIPANVDNCISFRRTRDPDFLA